MRGAGGAPAGCPIYLLGMGQVCHRYGWVGASVSRPGASAEALCSACTRVIFGRNRANRYSSATSVTASESSLAARSRH